MVNTEQYTALQKIFSAKKIKLVAVSKTKPVEDILELYKLGHRDFGENYVQELVQKQSQLPVDINWHFIGHLQSNKVKQIAPFIHLVHGVDSEKLLNEINKQASKNNSVIDCLLQVYIAKEESKFGLDEKELSAIDFSRYKNISIKGLMGMASFTDDMAIVRNEFRYLKNLYDRLASESNLNLEVLSMGMSADFEIAIEEGSNMVRIGSLLFGKR